MSPEARVGQLFIVSFNGTSAYVHVRDAPSQYPGTNSFTLEAWVQTSATGGVGCSSRLTAGAESVRPSAFPDAVRAARRWSWRRLLPVTDLGDRADPAATGAKSATTSCTCWEPAGAAGAEYKDIFAFAILILVLIFRPNGLLGENVTQKA